MIANELGMNEASLYNHFAGKQDLYDQIIQRFSERVILSGMVEPDRHAMDPSKSLFDLLRDDAEHFFQRTRNEEAMRMWRILMMEQYRHRETGEFVRSIVLNTPEEHLLRLLRELREIGKVRQGVPLEPAARTLAAIFFNYSFAANLEFFWEGKPKGLWRKLEEELRMLSDLLEA